MKVQNKKGKQSACLDSGITSSGSVFVVVLILLSHVCNLSASTLSISRSIPLAWHLKVVLATQIISEPSNRERDISKGGKLEQDLKGMRQIQSSHRTKIFSYYDVIPRWICNTSNVNWNDPYLYLSFN